jgi:glycosyltransferase involved in cell wall biosynthesis
MKVAMILTDEREEFHQYEKSVPYFGPAPTALLEGLRTLPEIELHIVSCTKKLMSAPEKLADNIWFHLLHVKQWGWLRSGYSGCVFAIRRKLREIQPGVVHGQGTERYGSLAAAFSGFPNIITIHGNMRPIARITGARVFSYQWCAARLEQFTLPRTDGVICVSTHTRSLVADAVGQTWVIPNAVSKDYFSNRPVTADARDVLCVGSVCSLKNQNSLIRALDPVVSQHKLRLVFLGKGDHSNRYFREFQRLVQARPWCRHEGLVDAVTVRKFLAGAYAVALPSLEDNCPMVLLEAAAAGVPVMAANVGGIPDIVQNEQTGLLFEPTNLKSIASCIERYLSDPGLAQRMGENSRIAAEKSFRPATIAKQHLEVYQQLSRADSSR